MALFYWLFTPIDELFWKGDLAPGDHIYSPRRPALGVYSHHGILIEDNKVIHFTGGSSRRPGCDCGQGDIGVILSCLDCFLKGGIVRPYKYGASKIEVAMLLGSRTVAPSDPVETVIFRAKHLLHNGFGQYDLWRRNCEDFALYCKTGYVVQGNARGASGQVSKLIFTRCRTDIGIRVDKIKLPVEHIFPVEVAESSTDVKRMAESSTNLFKMKSS